MTEIDPDFSRYAARILASPYFTVPPNDLDGEELYKWWDDRDAEHDLLKRAVIAGGTEASITGAAKEVWDKARAVIVSYMNAEEAADRVNGRGDF